MRLAIIDGTGPLSDEEYHGEMRDSFCQQLARYFGLTPAGDARENTQCLYLRGPSLDGFSTQFRAHRAADWLQRGAPPYLLAGYSRGGSAAIYAAELLAEKQKTVAALFLFDAVALHTYSYGRVVPANVAFGVHLHRENAREEIAAHANTIDAWTGNPYRPWWGNAGLRYLGKGEWILKGMKGSHAALGGPGWKAIASDFAASNAVAREMNRHLHGNGVPATLVGKQPRF